MSWIDLYRRSLRLTFKNPTAKSVWMSLVSFADEDGKCWPAIESRYPGKKCLASVSELSPRVISKWINHFVQIGIISRERGSRGSYYRLDLAEAERAFGAGHPESESDFPASDSSKLSKPRIKIESEAEIENLRTMLGEQRAIDLLEIRVAKSAPNTSGAIRALIAILEAHRDAGADVASLVDNCIRNGWASPKPPRKSSLGSSAHGAATRKTMAGSSRSTEETLFKLQAIDSERSRKRRELLVQRFPKNTHLQAAVFEGEGPGLQILCASPVSRQPLEDLANPIIRELADHGETFSWAIVEVYAPRASADGRSESSNLAAPRET